MFRGEYQIATMFEAQFQSVWNVEFRLGLLAASALVFGGICASVSGAASKPPSMSQILEGIRKKHDLPALAVVVVKDGTICSRAAVGVRKWGDPTPVTTNDVFHIGSCTKSMTATITGDVY